MIVTICYFLKSIKTVFILVQFNTSLSKNYVAHSVTLLCVTVDPEINRVVDSDRSAPIFGRLDRLSRRK